MPFTKTGLLKCKKRDFLNYNTYHVCGHTLEKSACTSTSRLQKDRHSVDLLEVSNVGNPSGSGPKKGYKRVESKIYVIKEQRELSQLKKELFRQFLQQS